MVQLDDQEGIPTQYCDNCDLEFTLLDETETPIEAYFCPSCGMNIEDYDEDNDEDDDDGMGDDDDFNEH